MDVRRLAARPGTDLLTPACPTSAVSCTRCGRGFGADPTLAVGCPVCGAAPAERCRKPPQGGLHTSHLARARIALGSHRMDPCRALTWDALHALPVVLPRPAPVTPDQDLRP